MQRIFFLLIFLLFNLGLSSQTSVFDLNFEFQAYPTGLIPGLKLEKGFSDRHAVSLRLGYQYIRHRDLGVHEDERGNGYGFTLGYKYYLKPNFRGLSLGIRNDIWFNELDWKDNIDTPEEISGTSEITVVQPTAEATYLFPLGESWVFAPSLAFGYEINVKTEGEPVGEGAILLIGLNFGKRF